MVQATNKCYNHLPLSTEGRLQTKCLVCIFGWSDIYNHQCKNEEPQPYTWFLNILKGIFIIIGLIFGVTTLVTLFVVSFLIYFVLIIAISPIALVYTIIINVYHSKWNYVFQFTILLPITAVKTLQLMIKMFI